MFFKTRKRKGVTLIEVLASLAILALLIIPIANLVINSSGTAKKSQDKQKASLAGQSVLEQIGNIDDSVHTGGTYNLKYTNMEGTIVDGGNIQFPASSATTCELADPGSSKYKIYVTLEKQMENQSAQQRGISLDTGDNFFDKYSESALAVQLSKMNEEGTNIKIYNPNDPTRSYVMNNNQSNVIYIASDGTCSICLNNSPGSDVPEKGSMLYPNIGTINNRYNVLRVFLAGTKMLDTSNAKTENKLPFSGDLKLAVISDYPGISNLNIAVTKGEDASTILKMPVKLGNNVPGSINVTEYSAENDMNNKLGDLYKVTVEVKSVNQNKDGSYDVIFSGSTTCNVLN